MSTAKKMIKNVRIIILLIVLFLALISIKPNPWNEGATIRFVAKNSSASLAGIEGPSAGGTPMSKETIKSINNVPITNAFDYYNFVDNIPLNKTFTLQTNERYYRITTKPEYKITVLNETEIIIVEEFDEELNMTVNVTKEVPKLLKEIIGTEDVGLVVYDAPTNNLRKGLDLSGGTRVVLKPEEKVTVEELDIVVSNIKERLNVYGLSDITVRTTKDLEGDEFIVVEIAGANKEEVRELLAGQGKFEAKVGEETVFKGGTDIIYVCRSADCSGIDFQSGGCGRSGNQWTCRFRFSIALSPEAAKRHANVTADLTTVVEGAETYLNESLYLYLDDQLVDTLRIGADLKGRVATEISISGSGIGQSEQEASTDALSNMKRLQTILITGSLPVKLNIVKTDSISPALGAEFIRNALLIGLFAILSVAIVVFIVYRKLAVSIPMIFTMLSEAIIILGVASIIGWNIDLAAIAGIIIALGTGVDHQIIITDEILKSSKTTYISWSDRIKNAFFIIMAAYFTTLVVMIPLLFAGAGLLKGFAITTIIGVSIGVFITRPAFAATLKILLEDKD